MNADLPLKEPGVHNGVWKSACDGLRQREDDANQNPRALAERKDGWLCLNVVEGLKLRTTYVGRSGVCEPSKSHMTKNCVLPQHLGTSIYFR